MSNNRYDDDQTQEQNEKKPIDRQEKKDKQHNPYQKDYEGSKSFNQ